MNKYIQFFIYKDFLSLSFTSNLQRRKVNFSSFLVTLMLAALCHSSLAEQTSAGKLTKLRTGTDGDAVVVHDSPLVNNANCSKTTEYRLGANNPAFNAHYSLLIAAYISQEEMYLAISETTCEDNFPEIRSVQLRQ